MKQEKQSLKEDKITEGAEEPASSYVGCWLAIPILSGQVGMAMMSPMKTAPRSGTGGLHPSPSSAIGGTLAPLRRGSESACVEA